MTLVPYFRNILNNRGVARNLLRGTNQGVAGSWDTYVRATPVLNNLSTILGILHEV